jgi:hypothetical protein
MKLFDEIAKANDGQPVKQLAQDFGVSEEQASEVIKQYIPALTNGMKRNISQGGLDDLLNVLAGGKHERYLERPDELTQPETIDDGNAILGHLFGDKEVSRELAGRTAQQTGISSDLLKQMLPVIAQLVMGAMSKQTTSSGLGRTSGSGLPGSGRTGGTSSAQPDVLTSLLDADGDGSVVDDLLGLAGKFFNR